MKKLFISTAFTLLSVIIFSQVAPDKYWVRFTDKNNSPYSVENPEEFLSQKAIDRRNAQEISIATNDLPVNPQYIQGVAEIGVTILNASKWLNSVTIYTTDPDALDEINSLPYVLSIQKGGTFKSSDDDDENMVKPFFDNEIYGVIDENELFKSAGSGKSYNYGAAYNQIHMLNGDVLHDMGYDGEGKTIAVLDAGFLNANSIGAFDSLWNNDQILGYKDFVNPLNPNIFGSHYHGSMVLSTMAANWPGQMVGTAPKADYWLLRSEDGESEYLIEELNWVSAAEFADSVGADIINSSLGYTINFTDPDHNHTYEEMDGNTTPITIGADIAASKGMVVCNSAGNSGDDPWLYIGAPADGDSVFSIGAVDAEGNYAYFSSIGPTADGRIKPNVVAQGLGSTYIEPWGGTVSSGNGTSFSSPITAGMVACLWQANSSKKNTEIMEAIQQSATLADNPNYELGYGIPDYVEANDLLNVTDNSELEFSNIFIKPNPFKDELLINYNSEKIESIEIIDISGKRLYFIDKINTTNNKQVTLSGLEKLNMGVYFLRINLGSTVITRKVVKN